MYVGEDGKPELDANGKYQLHPALIFNNKLAVLEARAKQSEDERLQAAVDIIREVLSPASSEPELSEEAAYYYPGKRGS